MKEASDLVQAESNYFADWWRKWRRLNTCWKWPLTNLWG